MCYEESTQGCETPSQGLIITTTASPSGYCGMPADCAANLLTYGPVVAILFEVRPLEHGVRLYVNHRHWGTSLYECEGEVYDKLTIGEAEDVIDATMFGLIGLPHPHGE